MTKAIELVAIGCSAGGFEALNTILPAIPVEFPAAVIVVLHIPADSGNLLADSFRKKCVAQVSEAEDKMPIEKGHIYFAPANYHILAEPDHVISLSTEEPVHYSRPSIDVLFESVAMAYGPAALGIVLTGANDDGAEGLQKIIAQGGRSIVQDPAEADYASMPEAALRLNPASKSLKISQIVEHLQGLARKEPHGKR